MTQQELDTYYLKVAEICSENSKATKLKVGAIIVKDQQIISDGFNGTPSGFDNRCEDEKYKESSKCFDCGQEHCEGCKNIKLKTRPEVLHAESNAITKCAKYGKATFGSTIYITHTPCIECAKLIIQAGIKRVVYKNFYKTLDGVKILRKSGIEVEQQ